VQRVWRALPAWGQEGDRLQQLCHSQVPGWAQTASSEIRQASSCPSDGHRTSGLMQQAICSGWASNHLYVFCNYMLSWCGGFYIAAFCIASRAKVHAADNEIHGSILSLCPAASRLAFTMSLRPACSLSQHVWSNQHHFFLYCC
jgi:hypothetical protein